MKIFYSWQSDLPNSTNRGFIQRALEKAAKTIRDDDSIQVEPVIDRDTEGIPGAPDIASTILEKIEQAQIFVCDVSIINQTQETRPTPNPNVLIELGYAMKTLGAERIVMVLNAAFGTPELLPFDLRMKRVVSYRMPVESQERSTERKRLETILEQGLRTIITKIDSQSPMPTLIPMSEQARIAIEDAKPTQASLVRKYMADLVGRLDELNPNLSGDAPDEKLVEAIEQTTGLVIEFANVAETIADINAQEAALTLYKGFASIIDRYRVRSGFSGKYRETDFDFFKFIGHELFVTFFSFLILMNRWELITTLLSEDIYIKNKPQGYAGSVPFHDISEYVGLLNFRNQRLNLRRISVHADLLVERHTTGDLGEVVPVEMFLAADYFLFLRGELQKDAPDGWIAWKPWSTLYMKQPPQYLEEAVRVKYAEKLLAPLGVTSIDSLRARFAERTSILTRMFSEGFWRDPMQYFDSQSIGSR